MKIHFDRTTNVRAPAIRALLCSMLVAFSVSPVIADNIQQTKTLSLNEAMQQTLAQHPALQVFPIRQQQLEAQKKNGQSQTGICCWC